MVKGKAPCTWYANADVAIAWAGRRWEVFKKFKCLISGQLRA